jgi:hypothetical protein
MAKAKAPRADFALPEGTRTSGGKGAYPLNTPGRVKAAPGLAARSEAKGNITKAQEARVDKAAAAKRGATNPKPASGGMKTCAKCGKKSAGAYCPGCGRKM